MLNLFTKTAPWMVASLFVATTAFGQQDANANKCRPQKSFEQGHELVQTQLMAGYNAPARIDVRGSWDINADASFIYWQASQENMELGITNTHSTPATTGLYGNVINMGFDYKPGFKVGMGMSFDHDNWDGRVEYTWFHMNERTSSNGPGTTGSGIAVMFGAPSGTTSSQVYNTVSQKWRLNMDIADFDLGRWYYSGTRLSFRPAIGIRADWIRQRLNGSAVNDGSTGAGSVDTMTTVQRTTSWALGPQVKFDANWMVGQGFRLYSAAEGDILYTNYTRLSSKETHTAVPGATYNQEISQHSIGYLRPHFDVELGLGWGTYFDNNNWHVDLSAGYGFQVFFDQNMFRRFDSSVQLGSSTAPNGNLYIQGLTATAKFDF